MNDLYQNLKTEFRDLDYRYGYAESFLNTKLAVQIKTLREQRGKTQAEIAAIMGTKQPGYRRFEDVNHSVWKTDTLWKIARAFGVRLNISFETFGSLLDEKRSFTKESLKREQFEDDPVFNVKTTEVDSMKVFGVSYPGFKEWNFPRGLPGSISVVSVEKSGWAASLLAPPLSQTKSQDLFERTSYQHGLLTPKVTNQQWDPNMTGNVQASGSATPRFIQGIRRSA